MFDRATPRRLRRLAALLLLLAGNSALAAQEAPILTLSRALELAEANYPGLAAASALTEAAAAGVAEARAAARPQLEIAADLARTTDPVRGFGGLLAQEKFGPENFDIGFLNQPDPLTHATTRLELFVPVYTGGRLTAARGAAGAGFEAAQAERERARQQLLRQVIDAYTGDLSMTDQVRTLAAAHQAAEENRKLVADLFATGLVVESDLLQARVRLAELEEMLAAAEAGTVVRRAALNTLLGLPADTRWQLDPALPELGASPFTGDGAGQEEAELAAAIEKASTQRPDLAAARARAQAAARMLDLRRAEKRPLVGAGASLESAADVPFGIDGSHWSALISARFTLFDGGARRAREDRAAAELRAAEAASRALLNGIALEVRQAREGQKSAARRLETAAAAEGLARRSLDIVRDRYREGLAPLVELLGAEASLTAAQTRQLEARRALLLARTELALAIGAL